MSTFSTLKIILHSMHKYQPRVHIIKKKDTSDTVAVDIERPSSLKKTFVFPDTVFTTVTAYQNQQVPYITCLTLPLPEVTSIYILLTFIIHCKTDR